MFFSVTRFLSLYLYLPCTSLSRAQSLLYCPWSPSLLGETPAFFMLGPDIFCFNVCAGEKRKEKRSRSGKNGHTCTFAFCFHYSLSFWKPMRGIINGDGFLSLSFLVWGHGERNLLFNPAPPSNTHLKSNLPNRDSAPHPCLRFHLINHSQPFSFDTSFPWVNHTVPYIMHTPNTKSYN